MPYSASKVIFLTVTRSLDPKISRLNRSWQLRLILKKSLAFTALAILLTAGCEKRPSELSAGRPDADGKSNSARSWLTDVTAQAGLSFVHDRHNTGDFRFPEINGAGVGVLDYDGDGWYDIYLVQGGQLPGVAGGRSLSDQLFRNLGDGTFENVTESAGIEATGYGIGCTCGDYDNDGDTDIFVYNVGANTMLRNEDDGTFSDVTAELELGDRRWAGGGTWLDYDADGWLDLFVANYAVWNPDQEQECTIRATGARDYCGPAQHKGDRDILYHNNGAGDGPRFTEVTELAGIHDIDATGMGVAAVDFNSDGLLDIYVANDVRPNNLWIQQPDHTFVDRATEMLCDLNEAGKPEASMGIVVEDLDRNGSFDLVLTHFWNQSNTVYLNEKSIFTDSTRQLGLHTPSFRFTGFGISGLDLRNDERLFLYVANGKANLASKVVYAPGNPYAEIDQLFEWSFENKHFEEKTDRAGPALAYAGVSRGSATIDYDNDGDLDLVVSENHGPVRLLRNDTPDNHWLEVRCLGPGGIRDELGAIVEIEAGQDLRRRVLYPASSYASSSDPRVHFGLGTAELVDRITIYWTDGSHTDWHDVAADQLFVARYDENSQ